MMACRAVAGPCRPAKAGTRGGGRTHNLRLRRPTLYPIELLAQGKPTIRIRAPLLNANCRDFAPSPASSTVTPTFESTRTTPHRSLIPLDGLQQRMVFLFPLFKPRQLFRRQPLRVHFHRLDERCPCPSPAQTEEAGHSPGEGSCQFPRGSGPTLKKARAGQRTAGCKGNGLSSRPLWPMPNALAVFIHFPNAVKRHAMNPPLPIHKPERLRVIAGKTYLRKRNRDDTFLNPVKVAQLELPARKLCVPADAVQQFVNGHCAHDYHCRPRNHSSASRSCFSRYACPSTPRTLK